jgi:signal transduction histidine kinase
MINVVVRAQDGGVLVAVNDRGSGVAEAKRQTIFEIFNRGSAAGPGRTGETGIGLSLVAQFTALHGGRAWVETTREAALPSASSCPRAEAASCSGPAARRTRSPSS